MYRNKKGKRLRQFQGSPLLSMIFFPACILYHELLLRLFDQSAPFFSIALIRIFFFSLAAGLLLFLITDLFPWRTFARIFVGVILACGTVLVCVERGCRNMFGLYFGLNIIGGMAGDVAGNFASTVWSVIWDILPFIVLSLIPLLIYVRFSAKIIRQKRNSWSNRIFVAGGFILFQAIAVILSALGNQQGDYTYNFSSNTAVVQYGLVNTIRLEVQYAIFGIPQIPTEVITQPEVTAPPAISDDPNDISEDPDETSTPVINGYNELEIDFDQLISETTDANLIAMHSYFKDKIPSQKNEYTGMFQDKNLILITAEAFSPYLISQELTPTLYRLTHEGFVFENYYQPDWTQSTVGGEFAVTTGIIPNWINGGWASSASVNNAMPFALGNQFSKIGYSVPAWHNYTYTYYGRDEYLSNFGYDYHGIGNGLELPHSTWPNSDLEMFQATADTYISNYAENGVNFHAYYMTVSGHGAYGWSDNAMSLKHRETIQAAYPNLSEPAQAYLACNLELEAAMAYLVEQLEAAGIADDTLIVLTSDHYPYLLTQGQPEDYYLELSPYQDSENETSRYRNTLIMWSASIEEPILVDTPCSSIDIIPTLSNLFGLEYDSRLFSGRDVFAENYQPDQVSTCMPLVIFANNKGMGNSWITAAGRYESSTGEFIPNEGVAVGDDYVQQVRQLVNTKIQFARLLITRDYYRIVFEQP